MPGRRCGPPPWPAGSEKRSEEDMNELPGRRPVADADVIFDVSLDLSSPGPPVVCGLQKRSEGERSFVLVEVHLR